MALPVFPCEAQTLPQSQPHGPALMAGYLPHASPLCLRGYAQADLSKPVVLSVKLDSSANSVVLKHFRDVLKKNIIINKAFK